MEKGKNSLLLAMRYVIYFSVAASIVFLGNAKDNIVLLLVFLLLYIINAQVRINFLKGSNLGIILSLLIELILIALLYKNFGGFTFIYYFIGIIDASIMLPKLQSLAIIFVFYLAVIFQSASPFYENLQNYRVINIIFNTLIVVGFGGVGRYIEEERSRKSEAQRLYDQLRISEQELKEAYVRLEQYSNTIEEITLLRERNRLSREIHDTVGHTLSTILIQLQALPFIIKDSAVDSKVMLDNLTEYTKNGIEDVRRAVRELKPSSFDTLNGIFVLKEFIHRFEKSSGVKVPFSVSKFSYELTPDQSFTFYRVFQEALNNSVRHGGATLIDINMNFTEKEIYLRIKDNGTGTKDFKKSFGLTSMIQRVRSLGGDITFYTEKNFEINIIIPKIQGAI